MPLSPSLKRKFDALAERLEVRVLASGEGGDETFELVPPRTLDGPRFWAELPARIARELKRFRPDAVLAQSAYEAAAALAARNLAGLPETPVLVDVHGDWRTSTRLYGSSLRRALSPLADAVSLVALRHADGVRTVSEYTSGLARDIGIEPADVFPAFMDLEPFADAPVQPLPERPTALFVGVLELYKNVDGLAAAWRLAAPRVPDATLRIVGRGSRADVVEELVADLPEQTTWTPSLAAHEVAEAMDASTLLVLPSRSEGMGRVVVEALLRGRPVVGARVGGIRDLVRDGGNGLLVDPSSPTSIADGLVRVLGDRTFAEWLASRARPSVEPWLASPEEYAARLHALVTRVAEPRLDDS